MDEKIRASFEKVRKDIDFLTEQIIILRRELEEIKQIKTNFRHESSTGNEGVPADRQTVRQTDQQTDFSRENQLDKASELLSSLDSIKKEVRLKFKRLTEQELLVFSAIYQLEEEKKASNEDYAIDYTLLSERLTLTESSIRDYIARLIKKGIPVEKTKINNKKVSLTISDSLKKIASLTTILHLREL